ncbi:MAG: CbbQ/NirQ/NorQ/GpvN family protein [Acidimicrobiia bacterium]|nr:CbbQ/NirQ/NorQ/GpvN family protein [Acidimicrobiia bacterium]
MIETYVVQGREMDVFSAAFERTLPVMLTGPTGCGKTTFVQEMADRLGRPCVTVSCHDDLTTADLVGRFLVFGGDVEWHDGPLTGAMRDGAICYLDEVVEARRDTLALLHSVTDQRRTLFVDRRRETVEAAEGFMLVASYNPRGRGAFKELRPSLRQRFVTIPMEYLPPERETELLVARTTVGPASAERLVRLATALRSEAVEAVVDPPSTRSLVLAAELLVAGVDERDAIETAILSPLASDRGVEDALRDLVRAALPDDAVPVSNTG